MRWLGWVVEVGGREGGVRLEGKARRGLEEGLEGRCLVRRN